jgi:hypothetical protein
MDNYLFKEKASQSGTDAKYAFLAQFPLFSTLSGRDRERLAGMMELKLNPGTLLSI